MIRKIKLSNFKCFQNLDLKCAPLTLLCGLNGMGKSTVIQALLVLRQSFESGDLFDGRLVLGGELADLGTGTDVLSKTRMVTLLNSRLRTTKSRLLGCCRSIVHIRQINWPPQQGV